jgi:hypothetical protein
LNVVYRDQKGKNNARAEEARGDAGAVGVSSGARAGVDGVTKKPKPKKVKVSVFVSSEVARLIRENVAKFDYRGKSQYIEALMYDHDVRMKEEAIMTSVTQEFALREGLRYIAHCLETGEVFDLGRDNFLRGDEVRVRLISFARKLANDELPNWIRLIQIQEDERALVKASKISILGETEQ